MTEEEYTRLGHRVIRNDGDIQELRREVEEIAEEELRSRGIRLEPLTAQTAENLIRPEAGENQ